MVVINKTRRPYSLQQILEVSSEIIGVLALVLLLTFSLVGWPWPWQALAASAALPFVINVMYMSHTLRKLRAEFSSSESTISSKLDVYSEILRRLSHGKDVRFIEILETPYDFYHALNTARELSSKTVRVMKLHHLGPQDANHDLQLKQTSTPQVLSETMTEMDAWYNGLRRWAGQRGRLVERISACPSKSMKDFILQAQSDMEGTTYIHHILPWDGDMPLLNLCVFDEEQVIITFSTRSWENPYKPVPGIWIKDQTVARFFKEKYYDRLREYCDHHKASCHD